MPGKSHGPRSLRGYSPWGRKESDTTERLQFHFHPFAEVKIYGTQPGCDFIFNSKNLSPVCSLGTEAQVA